MADPIMSLGKKLTDEVLPQRDAIHIAIAPMVMETAMKPGDRVGINRHGRAARNAMPHIGIVDPFLAEPLEKSDTAWVFLFPNTVTGMRHQWAHPAFDAAEAAIPLRASALEAARKVVEEMASKMGLSYDKLMRHADDYVAGYVDYVTEYGGEDWRDYFSADTFWPAYQTIKGLTVPNDKQDNFFSCSC